MERRAGDLRTNIPEKELRNIGTREIRILFGDAFERACALVNERRPLGEKIDIEALEGDVIGVMLHIRRSGRTPETPVRYRFDLAELKHNSQLRVGITAGNHAGFNYNFDLARESRTPDLQEILDGTLKSYRKSGAKRNSLKFPPSSLPPLAGPDEIERAIKETTLPSRGFRRRSPQE